MSIMNLITEVGVRTPPKSVYMFTAGLITVVTGEVIIPIIRITRHGIGITDMATIGVLVSVIIITGALHIIMALIMGAGIHRIITGIHTVITDIIIITAIITADPMPITPGAEDT